VDLWVSGYGNDLDCLAHGEFPEHPGSLDESREKPEIGVSAACIWGANSTDLAEIGPTGYGTWIARMFINSLIMKVLGIVLIIAGIAMIVFRGFSVQTEKKVVDIGPVEINKKENKWIGWPIYAGGLVAIAGVVLLVGAKKRD
jgi:uncharacterized membrane protein